MLHGSYSLIVNGRSVCTRWAWRYLEYYVQNNNKAIEVCVVSMSITEYISLSASKLDIVYTRGLGITYDPIRN